MSKKIILTLIAALAIVLLIGVISAFTGKKAPAEESSAEMLDLHDEMIIMPSVMPDGIVFDVPAGFTETASEFYDKYFVKNDASVIVTGDTLPNYNQTLDSFVDGVKEQYQQTAEHFRLLSEESPTISGIPCKLLEFTYDIVGSDSAQSMECTTLITIKSGKVFIFTCKSHLDTYAGYRNVFRKMLESIKFEDPAKTDLPQQTAPVSSDEALPEDAA